MVKNKEAQLSFYLASFENSISHESDLDALVGYTILATLNEPLRSGGREIPFELMPKIYGALFKMDRSLRTFESIENAAYQLVSEFQPQAQNWKRIPNGRGTVEERIIRSARFLREEVERRGPLSGTRNIYLGDYAVIERYF